MKSRPDRKVRGGATKDAHVRTLSRSIIRIMRGHKVRMVILAVLTERKKVRKLHIKRKDPGAFHSEGPNVAVFHVSRVITALTTNTGGVLAKGKV